MVKLRKFLDVSGLVKKADYKAKLSDIEKKYFPTSYYNNFTSEIIDAKIKEKELGNKFNICLKNSDLNAKLAALATKAELKAEKDKIVKLQTHNLSFLLGKNVFDDDAFQDMFAHQRTLDTLELKEDRDTD